AAHDFAAPAGRAAVEAPFGGFFGVFEVIFELGQVGGFFEFGQALGRVLGNEPGFAAHIDVAYALDFARSLGLGPRFGNAIEPDFGVDVEIAALERGQGRQGFGGQDFGFAAVALVHDEALDFDQDQIGFPVHAAKLDGPVEFAGGAVGGLCN